MTSSQTTVATTQKFSVPAFAPQSTWRIQRRLRSNICGQRLLIPRSFEPSRRRITSALAREETTLDQSIRNQVANQHFVITGATGLIGTALVNELQTANANITLLARTPFTARDKFSPRSKSLSILRYNAETTTLSPDVYEAISNADVIINLAGEPIEEGRWTDERKRILWDSRVRGTMKITDALRTSNSKAVFISTSAVGYYGTSETKTFTEEAAPGDDFLATLAAAWEEAALRNAQNSRTVVLRMGVVLANGGGALQKMSMAFRAFLGGPPGTGRQWFSWVHIEDVVRLILHASVDRKWEGVYNATAPQPVRLALFCKELGRAMGRPSWLPVPKQAIQAMLGNEAAELVLSGQQVLPRRTRANGFAYKFKDVGSALRQLVKAEEKTLSNTK